MPFALPSPPMLNMLRGHETLTRLIGKRRRLDPVSVLSHLHSSPNQFNPQVVNLTALSSPPPLAQFPEVGATELSTMSCMEVAGGDDASKRINCRETGKENFYMEWVQCPVCGEDVQGNDSSINSHLDLCLLKGTKCKNNQLTLSQFSGIHCSLTPTSRRQNRLSLKKGKLSSPHQSTMPESKVVRRTPSFEDKIKPTSDESENLFRNGGPQICEEFSNDLVSSYSTLKHESVTSMEKRSHEETTINFQNSACICPCHSKATRFSIDLREEDVIDSCSSHLEERKEMSTLAGPLETQVERHMFDTTVLETYIVGRRFNRHVKVEKDMEIRAVRDPENPKDPNAIKIVGPDNVGGLTLGHLPRDLSFHLSCLLDKGYLNIQAFVVTVPEKPLESVPIKLLCRKITVVETGDTDLFKDTWQKVLQIVEERGKEPLPPSAQSKYLQNFLFFFKTVLERDVHLFSEEELLFLGSFFSLTENAQRLFVRLYQRKGPWFRVSQISYADITDVMQASDELLDAGFMTAGDDLEKECSEQAIRERLHVLNVPELKQLISMTHWKKKRGDSRNPKKEDLLDWIIAAANEKHQNSSFQNCSGEEVKSLVLKVIGFCIRISDNASFLLWRLQRLFFLNGEQDMSAYLLVDIGAIKYPTYSCRPTRRIFATREILLAYEQALEVAQAMDMALGSNDQATVLHCLDKAGTCLDINEAQVAFAEDCEPGDAFLARFTAAWVYTAILTLGVSVLERERRYREAAVLLKKLLRQNCCPGRRGYWTVRLSMDLEHLGHKEESLEVAEAALNDPTIRHGDRVALQRRVLRLGKPPRRWKKPPYAAALMRSCKEVFIRGRPLNCVTGVKSRFYGFDGQQCSVEELALQHYAGEFGGGWQGLHSEGGIWMTLFALLMWDILFADIPNVFWHPFQTAPLDLNTDAFYLAREALIEAQLSRIHRGEASQLLATTWSKWYGTLCTGLNWDRHSLEELQVIASCVGGPGLVSVCRLLAEDFSGWRGGMPDLLLWRTPKNSSTMCSLCNCHGSEVPLGINQGQLPQGDAKLVEVKGPRDRLSEQQRAWIYLLMEAGLQVEVCKVIEHPKSQDI